MSYRDAIHVATIKLKSGGTLRRGEPFKMDSNGDRALPCDFANKIGIVDPFNDHEEYYSGEYFTGWMEPGTVTGIQHMWAHSSFPDRDISEKYLQDFCERWGIKYELMLEEFNCSDPTIYVAGHDVRNDYDFEGENMQMFWEHVKAVTNGKINRSDVRWVCGC